MVMDIQNPLLKSSPLLLGKGRISGHGHTSPSSEKVSFSAGKQKRGGGHGHTELPSEKLSSLFWEREWVVGRYGHGVG